MADETIEVVKVITAVKIKSFLSKLVYKNAILAKRKPDRPVCMTIHRDKPRNNNVQLPN